MIRWLPFRQMITCRFREFYREPEAVFWVYCFPLLLAVILGLAFSSRPPDPPDVDIEDTGDQQAIAAVKDPLEAAKHKHKVEVFSKDECKKRLSTGQSVLTVIPGSPSAGPTAYRYDPTRSESVVAFHWVDSVLVRAQAGTAVPEPREDFVTEKGSRYIDFLIPGLIGMNLMGGGLFGIGFVIVDMRVRKLFKRLLATPMRRTDFLLALLIARLLFLIPEMSMLLLVGHLGFGVPINGNVVTLAIVILAGVALFDALGLLVACRTEKTETVSGLIQLCMLPMYLLSGTFFSSKRFPDAIQPFIQALPLTQVNDALREVMLEGKSLTYVADRIAIMMVWTVICSALALKWFRWR